MNRRARRATIFLPIVVTLVLAAVIGVLVVLQNQRQTDQVSRAEDVGTAFLGDVGVFRSEAVKAVNASKESDPDALRKVVDRAIADPPELGDAPAYGTERSKSYAEAERVEKTFLVPFRQLSRELRRADVALDFIAAARKVLKLRATDYVGSTFVTSSAPVRTQLIPAFVRARDDFVKVRVPQGQGDLAATVRDALQYVINQATVLADRLDAGQSFSFGYNEQFQTAFEAVEGYATQVKGDVTEAVNAVTDRP